jgi:hypothetical protein
MLREEFGDGKCRTIHDMVVALAKKGKIPDHLAIRAAPKPTKKAECNFEQLLKFGQRQLVRDAVGSAVRNKVFEAREGSRGRKEYRCVMATKRHPVIGSKLLPDSMNKPSADTKYGLSYNTVYQKIEENPGISVDALVAALAPCIHSELSITRYTNVLVSRELRRKDQTVKELRAKVLAEQNADPVAFLEAARHHCVQVIITNLRRNNMIIEKRIFRAVKK